MAKFKINKDKCIRCGACASTCPKGMDWTDDNRPEIKDTEELEKCGGEEVCPYGAIEKEE